MSHTDERTPRDAISADDVADMLGMDRKSIYNAANRGQIPCRRVGRKLLFSRTAVLAWLQSAHASTP
jgi:excisionase family DNA binding protein